jgi:hypothetical protein
LYLGCQAKNNASGGRFMKNTADKLETSLSLISVCLGIGFGFSIMSLILFGAMFLSPNTELPDFAGFILFPMLLLTIANFSWGIPSLFLCSWIKEWQALISRWVQGFSIATSRLRNLTTTLDNWLYFLSWFPIALIALLSPFGIPFFLMFKNSGGGINMVDVFLIFIPIFTVLLNFIMLKNIRTWSSEVGNRATLQTTAINLPIQSSTLSRLLTFCQIIWGIILTTIVYSANTIIFWVPLPLSLIGIAFIVFWIFLLEWSKKFAHYTTVYAEKAFVA